MLSTLSLVSQLFSFQNLLENILKEEKFNSIITISPTTNFTVFEGMSSAFFSSSLDFPVLHFQGMNGVGEIPLKFQMNSQLLAILFLTSSNPSDNDIVVSAASKLLNFNRMAKVVVFILPTNSKTANLFQLFDKFWKLKFLNVIVAPIGPGNRDVTNNIYSYNHWPEFHLHNRTSSQINGNYFPDKFKNINAAPIRVATLSSPPRSFVYGGQTPSTIKYGGYLLNSLETFAKRVNGTLVAIEKSPYEGVR